MVIERAYRFFSDGLRQAGVWLLRLVVVRKAWILLAAGVAFAGCTGYGYSEADINNISEEEVYSSVNYTRRVLYDLYGRIRMGDNAGSFSPLKTSGLSVVMLDTATDDGAAEASSELQMLFNHLTGAVSASTGVVAGSQPWGWYYAAIRRANTYLELVDGSVLEPQEIFTSKAEARFLRAYYYHELYRWYGPFVILEERGDPYDRTLVRSDEATCVRWLVSEFDALIAPGSGLQDVPAGADWGIATRGAALAYKARTLLYAASPLHSGGAVSTGGGSGSGSGAGSGAGSGSGSGAGSGVGSAGWQGGASGVTWQEAADACKDMIDYAEAGGYYSLAPSYKYLFNTRVNPEYIFWYNRADDTDLYFLMPPFSPWNTSCEAGTVASQEFIDSFDMANGTPAFEYDGCGFATGVAAGSGYDEQNMYAGRDPRLDYCILHDGSVWPKVNGAPATIDISLPRNWVSGYFVCKYLDDRIDHRASKASTPMNFPCMRYAEILLDYAEAVNEASDTPAARALAVARLNQIRARAGITGVLDAADFTQATLRERIRRERRVELCWEEHRYFDIRRWGIASQVLTRPVHGIRRAADGSYERYEYQPRYYNPRMDLAPLPVKDVYLCPSIWQNPGY